MARARLEVCVDSLASARAAAAGGADRIELCAALAVGGITPSFGLIDTCCGTLGLPVMVMIRPRDGGFVYGSDELAVMQHDTQVARELGAAGVVLGTLDAQRRIDRHALATLIDAADDIEVTFHRAFDLVPDPHEALEQLVELGVTRVLTSGGAPTALEGAQRLTALVEQSRGRITVMPGGGIRPANLAALVQAVKASAYHGSARPEALPASRSDRLVEQLAAVDRPACTVQSVRALVEALEAAAAPGGQRPGSEGPQVPPSRPEEDRHGA